MKYISYIFFSDSDSTIEIWAYILAFRRRRWHSRQYGIPPSLVFDARVVCQVRRTRPSFHRSVSFHLYCTGINSTFCNDGSLCGECVFFMFHSGQIKPDFCCFRCCEHLSCKLPACVKVGTNLPVKCYFVLLWTETNFWTNSNIIYRWRVNVHASPIRGPFTNMVEP